MINLPKQKLLILFDGVCNLCNSSVQYVIKHDKRNNFVFAALQGDLGQEIIKKHEKDLKQLDSILLYIPEKGIFYKSTAALKIAYHLGFPNRLLTVFFIIPEVIRNWAYDFIAKRRYKWFGKNEFCMTPSPELKDRFL